MASGLPEHRSAFQRTSDWGYALGWDSTVARPASHFRPLALLLLFAGALSACGGSEGPKAPHVALTASERTELLVAHNAVRASASPTPSPALPALTWSPDLEIAAQRWADGCQWRHTPNLGAMGMGQNLAGGGPQASWALTDFVTGWADEAVFYDYAANTCAAGEACGHYTQLVWRGTAEVGCGVAMCPSAPPTFTQPWKYLVCNYSPPGNWVGQRPY
jgi:pathogenesis-related protein 1